MLRLSTGRQSSAMALVSGPFEPRFRRTQLLTGVWYTVYEADVVIGADGVKSQARERVLGIADAPKPSG